MRLSLLLTSTTVAPMVPLQMAAVPEAVTVVEKSIAIAQLQIRTANDAFQDGVTAFQAHDYERAIAAWQAALARYPTEGADQNAAITLNALGVFSKRLYR